VYITSHSLPLSIYTMIIHILISATIVVLLGLGIRHWVNTTYYRDRNKPWYYRNTRITTTITPLEFLWTTAIIVLLVVPATTMVSWKISKSSQLKYVEHINGWEVEATKQVTTCHRDGSCVHTYSCDPYIVMVTYRYSCGKSTCTGVRPETRYHSCPYAKEEWSYVVNTTLGEYNVGSHRLPYDYASNPWRTSRVIDHGTARSIGVGDPTFWLSAVARIDSGIPGPVTKLHTYDNYVLASRTTVLKTEVLEDIQQLMADSLLPKIRKPFRDFYVMDNVYVVGNILPPQGFNDAARRLASALGTLRQGDVRIVLVDVNATDNPDKYTNTLRAFWQSADLQGTREALPKNAVVLVLGINEVKRVVWSRAFTGMPTGNERLQVYLTTRVVGAPLTPDSLLGRLNPSTDTTTTLAVLPQTLLTQDGAYVRENMDVYNYLRGDIPPTSTAKVVGIVLSVIFGSLCWILPVMLHCSSERPSNQKF
jgi:hypothetical protein